MIGIWLLPYFLSLLFVFAKAQGPSLEPTCDPDWFGRPDNQDCKDALARLPDWGMTVTEDDGWEVLREEVVRDFVNAGSQPRIQSPENVQTPLVYTNGTCTVAVIIPYDDYLTNTMRVETRKFNARADSVRTSCVENQGSGGLLHGVREWRNRNMEGFPNVYICGVDSDAEKYLDYLYDCITDADGNALSRSEQQIGENENDWIGHIEGIDIPDPQDPAPKGGHRACSGSCLDLEDCDIGSDCLCASTKGILLSSTWGKHSCMHVAGTAIALAAAAISPSRVCRGRCLLGEDGMVEIDQSKDQTNATRAIDIPVANITDYFKPSSPVNEATRNGSLKKDQTDSDSSATPTGIPLISSPSQTSPTLICPCNCTYVSSSCCLSPFVWEEPSHQIRMEPPPANASVVCDTGSGKWVPKPTTSSTSLEHKSGFIGLGGVRWNSSAAHAVEIPRDILPK